WVADSFDGLPPPNEELYPADKNSNFHTMNPLKISIDDVKNNFKKYDLLDEQVKFLKGWFKDTLPNAPIEKLAVLRLDGDMYESTMDALTSLYPKLSIGGYILIDDYGAIDSCSKAVDDYRSKNNITEKILKVDHSGVYWQKS
ncbi:MAG: class I SAM-dependent methyltransferase, partial [Candidatus Sericytochromatia bacterium]|nr:class I SAM-dependent methyltransferase [Candidatus Sericytochromatia bacterium]